MRFDNFTTHQNWMSYAMKIASAVNTEVPIASLVVKDGKLISEAVNHTESLCDPTAHAEIISIRKAASLLDNWRLEGCTLYTTLEPCAMCAGAIINSRISKLVFGAYDLINGACGSSNNIFYVMNKHESLEIIGGILETEASSLLKDFFLLRR